MSFATQSPQKRYCRIANSLARTLRTIGLSRVARDGGPSLGEILRADLRRHAEDAEVEA